MLRTVELNDDLRPMAREISEVVTNRNLPSEMHSDWLEQAQRMP